MGHTNYVEPMDEECRKLCDALNLKKGIQTIESCCGHDELPFSIWFQADDLNALPDILYWFDEENCGFSGWSVQVTTDDLKSPVVFGIYGPASWKAYKQADFIARLITMDYQRGWELNV